MLSALSLGNAALCGPGVDVMIHQKGQSDCHSDRRSIGANLQYPYRPGIPQTYYRQGKAGQDEHPPQEYPGDFVDSYHDN